MPAAMVTGASRGIGAACAERLAREGWDVAVGYGSDAEAAAEVADRVREAGREAVTVGADARDPAAAERSVAEAERALGPLAAVVTSAGLTRDALAVRMDPATWAEPIAVNLTGAFLSLRAALAGMRARGSGCAVAIGSVVGRTGNAGQANYAASKAGLIALVRTLARELGPAGLRVNAVAPGFVRTRLTDVLDEEQTRALLARTALARLGDPEDIAGPVAFLCSERASFVSGAVLDVDGGLAL
jgi:3-oxoacyl-[acyl-carrier protein] reductase